MEQMLGYLADKLIISTFAKNTLKYTVVTELVLTSCDAQNVE